VCVLITDDSRGGDGLIANKDILSVADLRGKSVVFEKGSVSHFYLNVLLREAGLSEADIEPVEVPDIDSATAFLLRDAEATVTWGTMLLEAKRAPHGHLLTDSSERPGLLTSWLLSRPEVLADRRADFVALGRAWDAAVNYVQEHPDDAVGIMARSMGGSLADPAIFAESLKYLQYYDGERNLEFFGTPDQPGQIYQTAQYAIDVWSSLGELDFELTPADVIRHDLWVE
jgi:NitT/TauT family transport system substrate-binding protein